MVWALHMTTKEVKKVYRQGGGLICIQIRQYQRRGDGGQESNGPDRCCDARLFPQLSYDFLRKVIPNFRGLYRKDD